MPVEDVRGDGSHGDVVIDALTVPTRLMIATVLIVNLSLGFWLVRSSDFTRVQPQGANLEAVEREGAGRQGVDRGMDPMAIESAAPTASIVALGETPRSSN